MTNTKLIITGEIVAVGPRRQFLDGSMAPAVITLALTGPAHGDNLLTLIDGATGQTWHLDWRDGTPTLAPYER